MTESSRSSIRLEWACLLFIVATPLVVSAGLTAWNMGEQAGQVVSSIAKIQRGIIGLATVLPPTVLLLYVLHLRGVSMEYLGLRVDRLKWTVLEGLLLFGLAMGLLYVMVLRSGGEGNAVSPSPMLEITGMLGMVLYAFANGFFEELFRAYIIRRTADAWGWPGWGLLLSVAVFLAYHLFYRGWHLGWLAGIAVVWGVYYLWRRDVGAMAISHIALDLTTFMMNDAASS